MTQNNLPLSRTLFLGGAAADEAIGVAVNSTNTIVAAINTNGVGNLLRLSTAVGTTPLSQTTLGEAVRDMDIIRGTKMSSAI